MRHLLPALLLFCAACSNNERPEVPDNSSLLSVAQCSDGSNEARETYSVELTAVGAIRLFVDPELQQPFGGVNGESVWARAYSDTVWAVLVHDFDGEICEGFIAVDSITRVGGGG